MHFACEGSGAVDNVHPHVAQPDGRLIPFESFNHFFRDEKALKMCEPRTAVPASTQRRLQARASPQAIDTPVKM